MSAKKNPACKSRTFKYTASELRDAVFKKWDYIPTRATKVNCSFLSNITRLRSEDTPKNNCARINDLKKGSTPAAALKLRNKAKSASKSKKSGNKKGSKSTKPSTKRRMNASENKSGTKRKKAAKMTIVPRSEEEDEQEEEEANNNEASFWKFITEMGFEKEGGPYVEKVAAKYSKQDLEHFTKMAEKKIDQLTEKLDPYIRPHMNGDISDDQINDLIETIVARGKSYYNSATNKVDEMIENQDYSEVALLASLRRMSEDKA